MLSLIRFSEYQDQENFLRQIREVFSTVFAAHYSEIIVNARDTQNHSVLGGFSDLITKQFSGDISKYTKAEIFRKLKVLYSGPGIDDEIAFLLGLPAILQAVGSDIKDNPEVLASLSPPLSKEQKLEINDYFKILKDEGRNLREVDALAIVDIHGNMHGFCIYHVFYQNGETILHVRQAAMREKNKGFAGIMARYLSHHYPRGIYEANRRWGNNVLMKEMLLQKGLLSVSPPVLGYSDKYQGLRSVGPLLEMLLKHYNSTNSSKKIKSKLEIQPTGLKGSWEVESLRPVYSAMSFFKASSQDDMYLGKEQFYLKRPSF